MNKTVKVELGKDSYDIIFDDNFVESAIALIGVSSKCMFITQETIYRAFEDKFSVLKSLPNVEFHFIGQGEEEGPTQGRRELGRGRGRERRERHVDAEQQAE